MKTIAYVPLHYGKDYLSYAIESVYDHVDEILILYTPRPSHGHSSGLICPDKKDDLIDCVINYQDKITWMDGSWQREGEHRDYAVDYAKFHGYDIIVALDSDEVWNSQYLSELIKEVYDRKASKCLIWMRHLWRSFDFICDDAMRQERICYIGNNKGDLIYASQPVNQVWHFGYARRISDVNYKISIHGHSPEWITSKDVWLNSKYAAWPPAVDVHPTCKDTWHPKPFDKMQLPEFMRSHPYFNLERIE